MSAALETDPLAADLVRVLAGEEGGLPCDALALALRRRRSDVLAALRADERFIHEGILRGSHWRLAQEGPTEAHGTDNQGQSALHAPLGAPAASLDLEATPRP